MISTLTAGIFDERPTLSIEITSHSALALKGFLKIKVIQRIEATCINISLKGKEQTHWNEEESGTIVSSDDNSRLSSSVYVTGFNQICKFTQTLWTGSILEIGAYSFPFSFSLPSLPPSFESSHASISYKLFAVIDRPLKVDFKNKKSVKLECIIPITPVEIPYRIEKELNACRLLCFRSGYVHVAVNYTKNQFVSGDSFRFGLDLETSSKVQGIVVQLVQVFTMKGYAGTRERIRTEERTMSKRDIGCDLRRGGKVYIEGECPISCNSPSFRSSLIEVGYQVKLMFKTKICFNPSLSIPIFIGTGLNGNSANGTKEEVAKDEKLTEPPPYYEC